MKIKVEILFDADVLLTQGFAEIMADATLDADGSVTIPRSVGPLRSWGDVSLKRANGIWTAVREANE